MTSSRPRNVHSLASRWLRPLAVLLSGLFFQGCILITGNFDPFGEGLEPFEEKVVEGKGRHKILILDISDVITDRENRRPLGQGVPIGRAVLAALIALPLWKGAHHVRSLSIDFGGAERDTNLATVLYAIAAAGSILAIVAVVRL